ncbi:MAG: methionyl-tRNA formyltransferase [Patescibacteria group bacterium]|nr:methionyl-tRNA formyltransferase [Patescibacteria group bacterium]MDD4611291.1 methionyl-tRNA formyltransferase [Patescibacteria group bacterium]
MSNQPIKTIFIGTPDFGVPALEKLAADSDFEIVAVITQPDKKVGRKQILTPPPIKVLSKNLGLKIIQPEKIKEIVKEIKDLKPDLIITIAYGQIIPQAILDIPKYGCINVHGSLLPKYRGAACIAAAILNGDEETGITIMKMDASLDTGPILSQTKIKLAPTETAGTLFEKLSKLGADFLLPTIKDYISGKIKPTAQDNSQASYIKEFKKEDGMIDWQKNAIEIERFVRAMNPWPGAYTKITNYKLQITNILKIIKVEQTPIDINKYKAGEIFLYENKLAVQCGQDALIITKLQPEGKREMTSEEFLRGHKEIVNIILK